MNEKLKILLVNNYTARGGIPKSVAFLANAMSERDHDVTIISQKPIPAFFKPFYDFYCKVRELSLPAGKRPPLPLGTNRLEEMYPLSEKIKILPYSFTDNNLKIQKMRKKIKEIDADVCVCMLPDGSQLVWAVTLLGSGIPYVYSEHHNPHAIENEFWTRKGRLAAMSGADAIHLLLPSYLDSLPEFLRKRATAIPNAVSLPLKMAETSKAKKKKLLWLGRIHESLKQCCLAMDSFAMISDKFPDWNMEIAGDGPDFELAKAHALKLEKKYNISGRISFSGEVKNADSVLASAQAFCFSSRTEGMPIALMEAMAAALPCAAFSGCPGASDLILDGQNGLLANTMTAKALAEKLGEIMNDPGLRAVLGKNARESMIRFSEKNIIDKWEKLLCEAAGKKGNTEMDKFASEPFASSARLSAAARREWLWREFLYPVPETPDRYVAFILWNVWFRHIDWFRKQVLKQDVK